MTLKFAVDCYRLLGCVFFTSFWVRFRPRQMPGAASGCNRHKIKGTPPLTCHETGYSALYASLPLCTAINTSNRSSTCCSRFSAILTGHTVPSAEDPPLVTVPIWDYYYYYYF